MSGFTGEKYDQLVKIEHDVEAAGMRTTQMVSIDQDLLNEALQASSLPSIDEADIVDADPEDVIDRLTIDDGLIDQLMLGAIALREEFKGGPLILRSSARGDAIGNGVYTSKRFDPTSESMRKALAIVVSSYFTESAKIFRKRSGIAPGFAAFMQPMVGTVVEGEYAWSDVTLNPPGPKPLFYTPYSGNARLATPLHPIGSMKIQSGAGSAVEISGLPSLDMAESSDDGDSPRDVMAELAIMSMSPRGEDIDAIISGDPYVFKDERWRRNYGGYRRLHGGIGSGEVTLGALKELFFDLNERLGNNPTYFEFAVQATIHGERIFIIQKGDIATVGSVERLDQVARKTVIVDGVKVESGNGYSPKFDTIVCLTNEDKSELYEFDQSDAAEGGYMLVFHASRTPRNNPINITRLKNVKAFVTFESMDWSHTGSPEEHLVGYTDQLGIPLISISGRNVDREWQALIGYKHGQDDDSGDVSRAGNLIIRKGSFQVVTEADSRDGLVVVLDKTE